MARSKASQRWLKEHSDGPYVKMAQRDDYRLRTGYKLPEIREKGRILRSGMTVVDLGATSGGWLQITSRVIGDRGRLIAPDIPEMDSIPDVTFIQGDFIEDAVFARILEAIGDHPVDLVISDMAPNISGAWAVDQPRAIYLYKLTLDLAGCVLRPGGDFLIKIFQGEGFDQYHKQTREMFNKVRTRKPLSSRGRLQEQYLLAHDFRGEQTGMINPIACLLVDDLLCRDGQGFIEGYRQRLCMRALVQYFWPKGVWSSCEAVSRMEPTSEDSQLNNMTKGLILWLIIAAVLVTVVNSFSSPSGPQMLNYSDFIQQVKDSKIERVTVDDYAITGKRSDDDIFKTIRSMIQDGGLIGDLVNNDVVVEDKQLERQSIWIQLLVVSFPILVTITAFMFFICQMQGGGGGCDGPMSLGKSKARLLPKDQVKTTFADVAGCDEAKEEISELVKLLRNPGKSQRLGDRIPRSVLMVDPLGIGKTLLAEAIAGEAKILFFTIPGSDFVEMFISVSVSRVRDVFDQAKEHASHIIFIGEIGAVGRHRGAGLGGGHDEREQTLNQLLVGIDSFEMNDGIIVVAVTNRPDVLDPVLLRPGHFDCQTVVGLPDIHGHEQILKVHIRKVPLGDHVNPVAIAHSTPGFSGADLASLVNRASLFAACSNRRIVDTREFELAKGGIMTGAERRTMVMSEKEERDTVYYEAGHVVVGRLVPERDPVYGVSITPRGRALGVTMFLSEEDRYSLSKRALESQIRSLFGGHITEEMILGFESVVASTSDNTTRAIQLAWNMVTRWGSSGKLDPLIYAEEEGEVFLGRSTGNQYANVSGEIAKMIDQKARCIIDDCYGTARRLLDENRGKLEMMADVLMKYETIDSDQIDDIMAGRVPREPRDWQGGLGTGTPPANLEESGHHKNTPPIGGPAGKH